MINCNIPPVSFKKIKIFISKINKVYFLLGLIILLGLSLRVIPLTSYVTEDDYQKDSIALSGDARGYHQFALIFLNHGISGILDKNNEIYRDSTVPSMTAFRTPGYPLFIAVLYSIFGINYLAVFIIQIILDLLIIYLIFKISILIFNNKYVSIFASFLYAINPLAIMYSISMYSECFFTFSFILTIFVFFNALHQDKIWRFILVGLFLGLTTLIKPITIYFLPVFLIGMIFHYQLFWLNWKKHFKSFFIIVIFFMITISPWQFRNLSMFGHYNLTFQQGRELLVWRVGTCKAWIEDIDKSIIVYEIQKPYLEISDIFERSKMEQQGAIDYITTHPYEYISCSVDGIRRFFIISDLFLLNRLEDSNQWFSSSLKVSYNYFSHLGLSNQDRYILSKIYKINLYIEYAFIFIGLILIYKNKKTRGFIIFTIATIFYFALLAGMDSYSRYYYPVSPMIIILFSVSFFEVYKYMATHLVKDK